MFHERYLLKIIINVLTFLVNVNSSKPTAYEESLPLVTPYYN